MKILHTADLHLGQIIYQNYERSDEHKHFFDQLKHWCKEEKPDALVVSGDVFDIQQPSASTKMAFNEQIVELRRECPEMKIVVTAGNHDSASRLQAEHSIWALSGMHLVGTSPSVESNEGWEEDYIVRLDCGYIIAMPYMIGERKEQLQHILNKVAEENTEDKPVVMMGHTAVAGMDANGHNFDIGKLKTQDVDSLGEGYDYLALGHIHMPQTIGHKDDGMKEEVRYKAPVIRYSGSALHVSCDEAYPHTVSLVEIDKHGGNVNIKQLRIDELRHFYILPIDGSSFTTAEDAIEGVKEFAEKHQSGYFRLKVNYNVSLPSNFNQMVYDILSAYNDEIRFNPKVIWEGEPAATESTIKRPTFDVADLQQMTDPIEFIKKVDIPNLNMSLDELREAFEEVNEEMKRINEEASKKSNKKKSSTNENTEA